MKNKNFISLFALLAILTIFLSGCSETFSSTSESSEQATEPPNSSQAETATKSEQTEAELTTDHKIFLRISINTKEDELQAIADKYGYHLGIRRYNTDNRSRDENYVYTLYDPSLFKSETDETFNWGRSGQPRVEVKFYHANDDADTQYIVSCSFTQGGNGSILQSYDVSTGETKYSYWKQVTNAPARQDENWHLASSAEDAVRAYLSD